MLPVCASTNCSSIVLPFKSTVYVSAMTSHLQFTPLQDNFPGLAALDELECFFVLLVGKSMGNYWQDIQTGLQHCGHLVPGLVHLTPIDSFDRQSVKNNQIPIDCCPF